MNKIFALILVSFISVFSSAQDKSEKKVAEVQLKDINGNTVNTADMGFDGPVIILFWATHCSTSKNALNTIHDDYIDWQDETGVNLVAVSLDDSKTINSVPMLVNGNGWEYLVLMDSNGDFKRAMGVNIEPHIFLLDKDGNIVYSYNNYAPGDEEEIYDKLVELE
jgi:peroxiredoxin